MQLSYAEIEGGVASIIEDTIQDWDLDPDETVTADTSLVCDLGFSSIDIIHLMVAVEEHFMRPNLGLSELLMVDGKYIDDLRVAQLVDFLHTKLNDI